MSVALPVELTMRGDGHKLTPGANLVVTTLKHLYIDVQAQAAVKHVFSSFYVPIRAELVYENGFEVWGLNDEPPLSGDTSVLLIQGAATFKLKINPKAKVTSDQCEKKNFRIRISAVNGSHMQAHTAAFKIMVRVDRPLAAQREAAAGLLQFGSAPATEEREWERQVNEHGAQLKALKEDNVRILNQLRELRKLL